ncbi:MAG: superoxide dismutase family protein [Pseudomonadales bacterium]
MSIPTWMAAAAAAMILGGFGSPALAVAETAQPQRHDDPQARPGAAAASQRSRLEAPVVGTDGEVIGAASVEQLDGDGVRVSLYVEGLEPGMKAVHFHEHGRCDPPDFESAGGHFDPVNARHGMPGFGPDMDTEEHHAGDMFNQLVDGRGIMDTVMTNHLVNLDQGANQLLTGDGTALVIHAGQDDYQTQPAGDAGPRVACAVIRGPPE